VSTGFSLDRAPFANNTGKGITVAVIDSGIQANHPHIGVPVRGIHLDAQGEDNDVADRLGHGTAVAAAILEKAPAVELVAVRVFDRTLATNAAILAKAIERATEAGSRLINLSLGTANPGRTMVLENAIQTARAAGAIVVSAYELDGTFWLPGSLDGVVGVLLDRECPRDELRVEKGRRPRLMASGYPRPIPGVPPARNLQGISFAVANTTGFLARLLETRPDLRTAESIIETLT
jgi:hypothetical protein